jgi:hypothetical protein
MSLRCGPASDASGYIWSASGRWLHPGAIRPPEVTRCRLSEAVAAHKLSQSRHFRGKLVFWSVETASLRPAIFDRRKFEGLRPARLVLSNRVS